MPIKLVGKLKKTLSRGFGFIETKDGIDFFFHHSAVIGDFKELVKYWVNRGEGAVIVEFDNDGTAPTGPRAINVKYVETREKL